MSASITRAGACGPIRSCLTTRRWVPAPQGAKSAPTSRQARVRTRRVPVISCAIARCKSRLDEHVFVRSRASRTRRPRSSSRRPRPSPLSRQKLRCLLRPHSRRERPRGRCRRSAHRWGTFEEKHVGCHPDAVAHDADICPARRHGCRAGHAIRRGASTPRWLGTVLAQARAEVNCIQ